MFKRIWRFSVANKLITLYRKHDFEGLQAFWTRFKAFPREDQQNIIMRTSAVLASHFPAEHQILEGDLMRYGFVDENFEWRL